MRAYERLARARALVARTVFELGQKLHRLDVVSRSTSSDSMPGNVEMEIDDAMALLTRLRDGIRASMSGDGNGGQ